MYRARLKKFQANFTDEDYEKLFQQKLKEKEDKERQNKWKNIEVKEAKKKKPSRAELFRQKQQAVIYPCPIH